MAIGKTFGQFFSPEYFVTGNTGKHVDELRSVDTPYIQTYEFEWDTPRKISVMADRVKAFDQFAQEQVELKARQDIALMIALMEEI